MVIRPGVSTDAAGPEAVLVDVQARVTAVPELSVRDAVVPGAAVVPPSSEDDGTGPRAPVPPDRGCGKGWDTFDEHERRRHLATMEPDAVRALAATMPLIEQAKGILMGFLGCDAATAFALLNRASSSKNVKLRVLAAGVVQAVSSTATTSTTTTGRPASPYERVLRVLLLDDDPELHDRGLDDDDDQGSGRGRQTGWRL